MFIMCDIMCEGGRDSLLILETGDTKTLVGGLHKWDGNLAKTGSKPTTSFLDRKDF